MPQRIGDYTPKNAGNYMSRRLVRSRKVMVLAKEAEQAACILRIRQSLRECSKVSKGLVELAQVDDDARAEWRECKKLELRMIEVYSDVCGFSKRPGGTGPSRGAGATPVFDADLVLPGENGLPDGLEPQAEPAQPA